MGAAINALGMGIEWLIEKLTGSSEATDKLGQKMKETSNAFEDQRKQALAPTLTKYQELQTKWKSLKSVHEKNQFIKTNKDAGSEDWKDMVGGVRVRCTRLHNHRMKKYWQTRKDMNYGIPYKGSKNKIIKWLL